MKLAERLKKKVVELTGDVTPDARAIAAADLIITTPEKWDGISRRFGCVLFRFVSSGICSLPVLTPRPSWQNRSYVKSVAVIVIDEVSFATLCWVGLR